MNGKKTCPVCGDEFESKNSLAVYCPKKYCKEKGRKLFGRQTYRPAVANTTCRHCGKSIEYNPAGGKTKYFCNRDCWRNYNGAKKKSKEITVTCARCGGDFVAQRNRGGKRYCNECREKFINPQYMKDWQKSHPNMCPCGKATQSSASKYCSPECRSKYGAYRRAETKRASCIGCGNVFERPHHYPSKMMYCSNECAKLHQKARSDILVRSGEFDGVVLDSMAEVRFIAACARFGIQWRAFDLEAIDAKEFGLYRPDFIVSRGNKELVVEVKGGGDFHGREGEVLEKAKAARDALGDGYVMLTRSILEKFEEGDLSAISL